MKTGYARRISSMLSDPRGPTRPLYHGLVFVLICTTFLLILTGCGRNKGVFERTTTYPLVAFQSEAGDRVRVSGSPKVEWIELPNGRHRAITGKDDYELWISVDDLGGMELAGMLGLQETRNSRDVPGVTFRLLAATEDGTQRIVLAEYVQTETNLSLQAFREPLGRTISGPGQVGLQVAYGDGIPPRNHPLAAWIEPTMERTTTDTIRCRRDAPNVLLITADTTRQDDLECYGGPAATPALNELVDDGVLFSSAYSVAYGTTPSHASLLTARYAAEHGVYNNGGILRQNDTTLAEVLRSQGYVTAAFVSSAPVGRSLGLEQGFDLYDDALVVDDTRREFSLTRHERSADVTVELFLEWLRNRSNNRVPFFAWIHLFDPHQPYASPPLMDERLRASPDTLVGISAFFVSPDGSPRVLTRSFCEDLDRSLLLKVNRIARARYRDEITFMDEQIARTVDALKVMDLYRRTLIVFVADHGEHFLDRGRRLAFSHRGLYQEVSLLPLIVKLPGQAYAGTKQGFLLGNHDIAPTILDVVGVDQPSEWSGKSFAPELCNRDEHDVFREHLVIESGKGREIGVKTADWSYRELVDPKKTPPPIASTLGYKDGHSAQLYSLSGDPNEREDLIGDEQSGEIDSVFHAIAEAFLLEKSDSTAKTTDSPHHQEALKALGYIE